MPVTLSLMEWFHWTSFEIVFHLHHIRRLFCDKTQRLKDCCHLDICFLFSARFSSSRRWVPPLPVTPIRIPPPRVANTLLPLRRRPTCHLNLTSCTPLWPGPTIPPDTWVMGKLGKKRNLIQCQLIPFRGRSHQRNTPLVSIGSLVYDSFTTSVSSCWLTDWQWLEWPFLLYINLLIYVLATENIILL